MILPRILGIALTLVVLVSVLGLGGNRVWAWSSLFLAVALVAVIATAASSTIRRQMVATLARLGMPLALFGAVLCWAVAQPGFSDPVQVNSLTGLAAIDQQRASSFLLRQVTYLLVFVLTVACIQDRKQASRLLHLTAAFTTLLAVAAITLAVSGIELFPGQGLNAGTGKAKATFVNQNSYVMYAAFGLFVNLTLLRAPFSDLRERIEAGQATVKAVLRTLGGLEMMLIIGVISNLCALAFTGSRAGIFSALIGLIAILAVMALSRGLKISYARFAIFLIPVLLVGLVFANQILVRYYFGTGHDGLRLSAYIQIMAMLQDHWLTGVGLGGFQDGFLQYRSAELSWLTWGYAHNSYLELAAELGVPAAAAYFTAIGWVNALIIRSAWRRGFERSAPNILIACTVAAVLHSAVDFSLQMPATASLFAMLMGIAWASVNLPQGRKSR